MNIIRVLVYWHSYVHHGGFNLVHITYQVTTWITSQDHQVHITKSPGSHHLPDQYCRLWHPYWACRHVCHASSRVERGGSHIQFVEESYQRFIQKVTGLESYISSIVISLPVFALAIAARFGTQKIQTWVVVFSSAIFALLFIVTFLYELVTGFIDLCFTSMIVITYSMVFGSYLVMSILHPR